MSVIRVSIMVVLSRDYVILALSKNGSPKKKKERWKLFTEKRWSHCKSASFERLQITLVSLCSLTP